MKRKTKFVLFGAIAGGALVMLLINLTTPQGSSEVPDLRKPAPDAPEMSGL